MRNSVKEKTMETNKKSYTPVKIKPVITTKDVVRTSQPTAADYDPFVKDVYFTEDQ